MRLFKLYLLPILLCANLGIAQQGWNWTPLADMPEKVSNNAVCEGMMGGNMYVYSFGGIDTTKIWSGINKGAYRYDVTNNVWDQIDTLPVVLPLIASSANRVQNKIYIIGGYHVYAGGSEISSDEVIIYNPETNSYEPNGAPIPVPIDDQAQMVYKDSLIYVVTGWSNTTNVPNVQIYDPALDQWQVGTDLPNTTEYKVFGSSGQIIGDTIYYYGGASTGWNFPAQWKLRKGIIDPSDPTQITWSVEEDAPNRNYRSACLTYGNNLFWVGGSATSYNYNGVAYNGSGGVEPSLNIARYEAYHHHWYEGGTTPYGVMDMRGNGQVSPTEWIIAGGMESGQQVSDKTYLLTYDPITGSTPSYEKPHYSLINGKLIVGDDVDEARLLTVDGKLVSSNPEFFIPIIHGVFILELKSNGKTFREKVIF